MYNDIELIKRLQRLFIDSGLTYEAFGRKAGITGAAVHRYFSLGIVPKAYALAGICEAFGISVNWLMFGKGEKYV